MGFVGNKTVVSESVGSFIETVRVFLPEPDESLPVQFFLNLETQDGSAGEDGWGRVTVNDIIKVEKYEIKFTYFILPLKKHSLSIQWFYSNIIVVCNTFKM